MEVADDLTPARTRLTLSIKKLTEPYQTTIKQRGEGAKGWRLTPIHHPPLILALENAVAGDMGSGSVGAPSQTSSLIINVDAVTKLSALAHSIHNSWEHFIPHSELLTGDMPLRKSLRVWHVMFDQYITAGTIILPRVVTEDKKWGNWVADIETMFSPERRTEYTPPCPGCGARWVETAHPYGDDPEHSYVDRTPAIMITWREPVDKSSATCGSCRMSWMGVTGLELLSHGKPATRRIQDQQFAM